MCCIPGAKYIKLSIDSKSFDKNGISITLYNKPNSQDPIPNCNFISQPNKPIKINNDTCYIVYNSGYTNKNYSVMRNVSAKVI